jgi:hypothetical protein
MTAYRAYGKKFLPEKPMQISTSFSLDWTPLIQCMTIIKVEKCPVPGDALV